MGKSTEAAKGVRETMATSDLKPTALPPLRGILKKKGSGKSDSPDNAGTAKSRRNVLDENQGSRLTISPNMNAMPSSNPESRNTQGNGRIVRSTPGRWGNFGEGIDFAGRG